MLVHRIAFLVRVQRTAPRSILALAYNRHAAVEIRKRLKTLIGDDAKGGRRRNLSRLRDAHHGAGTGRDRAQVGRQ